MNKLIQPNQQEITNTNNQQLFIVKQFLNSKKEIIIL